MRGLKTPVAMDLPILSYRGVGLHLGSLKLSIRSLSAPTACSGTTPRFVRTDLVACPEGVKSAKKGYALRWFRSPPISGNAQRDEAFQPWANERTRWRGNALRAERSK
jgi:hypothetical protein